MAQDRVPDAIPAKPATYAEISHAIESLTDGDSDPL
jgi:hypothetical protein